MTTTCRCAPVRDPVLDGPRPSERRSPSHRVADRGGRRPRCSTPFARRRAGSRRARRVRRSRCRRTRRVHRSPAGQSPAWCDRHHRAARPSRRRPGRGARLRTAATHTRTIASCCIGTAKSTSRRPGRTVAQRSNRPRRSQSYNVLTATGLAARCDARVPSRTTPTIRGRRVSSAGAEQPEVIVAEVGETERSRVERCRSSADRHPALVDDQILDHVRRSRPNEDQLAHETGQRMPRGSELRSVLRLRRAGSDLTHLPARRDRSASALAIPSA